MTSDTPVDVRLALILLLIDGLGELRGRTRLQKLVFLAQKEGSADDYRELFEFVPYRFGPFSKELDAFVSVAKRLELVFEVPYEVETPYGKAAGYLFRLTPRGEEEIAVTSEASSVLSRIVREIIDAFGSLDMSDLLRYVYDHYPTMASPASE